MTMATGSPHNHFNCTRGCDPARPLTLIDREVITGRQIAEQDDDSNWYCADCLADLPRYANGNLDFAALWHVCGEEPTTSEPEPAVTHKTRTTQPVGYSEDDSGCRRFDKRGRVMFDRGSFALCSCGWIGAGATREEARSAARAHREREDRLALART